MTRRKKAAQRAFGDFAPWAEPKAARPQVTQERIVQGALDGLEEQGFDGLTMRALADRLVSRRPRSTITSTTRTNCWR